MPSFELPKRLTGLRRGLSSAWGRVRALVNSPSGLRGERGLDLAVLEDRVLLSAVPVAAAPMPETVDVAVITPTGDSAAVCAGMPAPTDLDAVMLALHDADTDAKDEFSLAAFDVSTSDVWADEINRNSLASGSGGNDAANLATEPDASTFRLIGAAEAGVDGAERESRSDIAYEIAFIDSGAADVEKLVADLKAQQAAGRNIDVFVLDASRDGIEQITEILKQQSGVDAVHVVSHATEKGVKLGSTWLTNESLAGNAGAIANWGWALSSDADVLFYGCDLASNAAGQELLESISALTGADVAASVDDTGSETLGGDWLLEYHIGDVAEPALFSSELQADWGGLLNTFVVTTTADSGAGSLRQAIIDANALAGTDTINFNISGSGTRTIALLSELPDITGSVVINGASQTGFTGTPLIELDGRLAGATASGLTLKTGSSTIRGLSIVGFGSHGVEMNSDSNVLVQSYVGVRASGMVLANGGNGVLITAKFSTVGGTVSTDRNVFSGNLGAGVLVFGNQATNNTISGNFIGTNVAGSASIGNQQGGVQIDRGRFNTIGGLTPGAGNVISGNVGSAIFLTGTSADGNLIYGNKIGVANDGTTSLGNSGHGVEITGGAIRTEVGDGSAAGSNTIRFNAGHGVVITDGASSTLENFIRRNSISDNGGLGIDLGNDGVNANDVSDLDVGPNDRQNAPVITLVTTNATSTTIYGRLNSILTTSFDIDFYSSPTADGSGYGEGQTYLGTTTVTTDGVNGDVYFTFTLPSVVAANSVISATATQNGGNTSEFSKAILANSYVLLKSTSETLINASVADVQRTSGENRGSSRAVAIAPDGTYFVVWSEQPSGQNWKVMAARYDSNGAVLTAPFQVSTVGGNDAQWATVAVDSFGRAVVAWTESGTDGGGKGIYARRLNADGSLLGATFRVNTHTALDQQNPNLAVDAAGNFVIVWDGEGPGGNGVYGRRYDANGVALDAVEFTIATGVSLLSPDPVVAMSGNGRFVVAWQNIYDVQARVYQFSNLSNVTGVITVDTGSLFDLADRASVGIADDGSFVVSWTRATNVKRHAYNPDGTPNGTAQTVNTTTTGFQYSPSVAMAPDGSYIITWEGNGLGDSAGIFFQKFDSTGAAVGGETLVNVTTTGTQDLASVAIQDIDNFVVVWSGNGTGDSSGVFRRQYGTVPANLPPTIISGSGVSVAENTTAVMTVAATDPDLPAQTLTFSISGGADAAQFAINSATGALSFVTAPDFETPTDVGSNNIYDVIVQVSDGTLIDTQAIAVTVTDAVDTIVVTTTADLVDGDTSSAESLLLSPGGDGLISLREAIMATNGSPGINTIVLPAGTFTLALTGSESTNSPNAAINDLDITDSVVIVGAGSGQTIIDANSIHRVFQTSASTSVTIRDLTIRGGVTDAVSGLGGGIYAKGTTLTLERIIVTGNHATYAGGGVTIEGGTATLTDVAITNNTTASYGGGLHVSSNSTATLNRVTIAGNTSSGDGGGVFNSSGGAMTFTNVTISGNSAVDKGGAIYVSNNLTMMNSTIINNTAATTAGVYQGTGPAFTIAMTNSILSNVGGNTNSAFTSGTNNIISDATTGLTGPTNQIGVSPLLSALGSYGGIGQSHALLIGSPAINAGTTAGAPGVDQRGVTRDATPDIGAFEFTNTVPMITSNGGVATATVSINENTTAVTTVTATDTDVPAQTLTYSISGGADAAKFTINSSTGVLSFLLARDFESPGDVGLNNVYDVIVQVSDGLLTDTQSIAVAILPMNDNSPIISSNGGGGTATISVAENTTAVTTVTATDGDLPAQTQTYSISGGADAAKFTINSSTGVLSFLAAPDYEAPTDAGANNVYDVTVRVSDGSLTDTQAIAVLVTNSLTGDILIASQDTYIDRINPTLNYGQSPNLILNKAGGGIGDGRVLLKFNLSDLPVGATITSATLQMNSTQIGGSIGINVYQLTQDWTEGSGTGTLGQANWNQRQPSVNWATAGGDFSGTIVASLTTASTGTHTWDVTSLVTDWYLGNAANEGVILGSPDLGVFTVTYDSAEGAVAPRLIVTIDASNSPPAITSNGGSGTASVSVAENSTIVTTVTATDSDVPAQTLTYSITGGADAAKFAINSSTGVLSFASAPDYEVPTDVGGDNVYEVTVAVSDGLGLDTQAISVTVTPVNDNPPVITSNGGGAAATISVAENTTAVTTVTATDADLPAQTLTYSISGGADAAKFTINGSTGVLTFVTAPNFESPTDVGGNNVYDIIVRVSDGSLTDTQTLAITVTNVNEAPTAVNDSFTTVEEQQLNDPATGVLGNDTDPEGAGITTVLVAGPTNGTLTLNPDGSFSYTPNPFFNGTDTFTYRATDGVSNSNVATVTINVTASPSLDSKSEFRVNTTTADVQETSSEGRGSHKAVAMQPDGSYVVVWSSENQDGSGRGVYGQRFSKTGAAIGSEFRINQTTTGDQMWAHVSTDAAGNFVVVWKSPDASGGGVFARRYSANGTALSGEFQVNTTTSLEQDAATVVMQPDGGFIIVWDGAGPTHSQGIFMRRYDASGVALTLAEEQVNTTVANCFDPTIDIDAFGNFVIAWDDGVGVHFRRYSKNGTSLDVNQVLVEADANAGDGSIGVAADGSFVITWRDSSDGDGVGNGTGVLARRYNSAGVAQGAAFVVNTTIAGNQTNPTLAMDADGSFVIVWEGNGIGDGDGVFGQKFNSDGTRSGNEFRINQTTLNAQNQVSVAMIDLDNIVAVWSGNGPGDTSGVFARQIIQNQATAEASAIGPTIDGIADSTWSVAEKHDITNLVVANDGTPTATDLSANWQVLWNPANLFLFVEVTDQTLLNNSPNPWDDDCIEIYIDANHSGGTSFDGTTDFHYLFRVSDPTLHFGLNSVPDATGMVATLRTTAAGYNLEVSIPWTTLNVTPNPGDLIGIDVGVDDDDASPPPGRDSKIIWSATTDNGYQNPSLFGTAQLADGNLYVPTITSSSTPTISENTTLAKTVAATDADTPAQTLTFSITGGADAGLFAIDASTGELTFLTAPNFEVPTDAGSNNVYNVTVAVSDGFVSTTQAIAITVTNVNEVPAITSNGGGNSATISIAENTTAVTDVNATDPDAAASLTYSISGGADAAKFTINGTTGVLAFITAPDFDNPTDGDDNNVYDVIVRVSDGSLTDTQALAVTVTNVNEAPTVSLANSALSYSEQAAPVTIDAALTINDPDGGDITGVTVTITGGLLNDFDELLITLNHSIDGTFDPATDTLTLTGTRPADDYEDVLRTLQFRNLSDTPFASTRTITITVTDGTLTGSDSRNVTVTAVNDPPTIVVADPNLTFAEGSPPLVIDAGLIASDVDNFQLTGATISISGNFTAGQDVLTFTPSGPITGNYNSATGILTLTGNASPSDYQATLRSVMYQNTSNSPNTAPRTISFTINDGAATASDSRVVQIQNVNSAPTLNPASFSLPENSANGTVVGTVTATDPDVGDTLTFTITGGNTGGAFAINSTTGQITVAASSALNFETTPIFSLTVQVTDSGSLQSSAPITITLTNINEAPTITSDGAGNTATISIPENTTAVTTVTATDVDASSTLTFSIVGGADQTRFTINSTTGVLTFNTGRNFENPADAGANNIYDVTVQVTDGSLIDRQDIAVTITDVNEAPIITSNGAGANANIPVAENSTVVTTVIATDVDAGTTLSFSISGGSDASLFTINPTTGALSFTAAPNFEDPDDTGADNIYNVTVRVTDGSLSDTQNISVTIINVNEAPALNPATFNLAENSAIGTVVGSTSATDPDAGDTHTFAIIGGNLGGAFAINTTTGQITVANSAPLNFELNPTFSLTVRVTDGGGLVGSNTITINLTDANDPPNVTPANFTLAENSTNGTIVGTATATDPDATDTHTFSIVGGNFGGAFVINATTGQITVANFAAVNFETTPVFHLAVRATDSGGLFGTANIQINLTNVNEAPILNDATQGITEDATLGSTVIDMNAFDPDAGDPCSFAILGGNIDGAFGINPLNGRVFVANPSLLNAATTPTYNLVVQVTDSFGLTDTATLTINVASSQIIAPPPPSGGSGSGGNGTTDNGSTSTGNTNNNNNDNEASGPIVAPPPTSSGGSGNSNNPQSGSGSGANNIPTTETTNSDSDAENGNGALLVTGESLIKKTSGDRQPDFRTGNASTSLHTGGTAETETSTAEVSLRDSLRFGDEDLGFLVDQGYLKELKQLEENIGDDPITPEWVTGSAAATTAGLSIGYILWLLRSGYLVTSVLATLPMWQSVDPLPILSQLTDDEDDESLDEMIERAENEHDRMNPELRSVTT